MNTKKHNSRAPLTMLFLSLIILITLFIYYFFNNHYNHKPDSSLSMSVDNIIETSSIEPDYIKSAENEYSISSLDNTDYPDSFSLDIPYISQYPQLPTGCEITALAEVLHYLGYNIDKEELARNYLDMKDIATKGCFVEYFWGSPWKSSGSGCFCTCHCKCCKCIFQSK